jgi:hypothetical protein
MVAARKSRESILYAQITWTSLATQDSPAFHFFIPFSKPNNIIQNLNHRDFQFRFIH